MTLLRDYLGKKRANGEAILSIYLTAGFPDPKATLPILDSIVKAGADLIELGVPFSDPMADGPTIQAASQKALKAGTTLEVTFEILRQFRAKHSLPLLLMGYANPFYKFGWERLVKESLRSGANGFIIPDLPPEESQDIHAHMREAGMDMIFLASPNTPPERIALIDKISGGFIYAVSLAGVTGARESLPQETEFFLKRLRKQTSRPILIGFGISNAATAGRLGSLGDGVIIGSAVIERIAKSATIRDACQSVYQFIHEIKLALGVVQK